MHSYKIYAKIDSQLAQWEVLANSYVEAIELVKVDTQLESAILCLLEENAR